MKIMYALKNIRKVANAKFNLNLFRVLIVPSYLLLKGVYFWLKESDRQAIISSFNVSFKKWMGIPIATPTILVEMIVGNVDVFLR